MTTLTTSPRTLSSRVEIHTLTSYHATLLNRDETGAAKRIVLGGAPRIRVSSQCRKRHWRQAAASVGFDPARFSTRSKQTMEELVIKPLIAERGYDAELVRAAARAVVDEIGGTGKGKGKASATVLMDQVLPLGPGEILGMRRALDLACQNATTPQAAVDEMKNMLTTQPELRAALTKPDQSGDDVALFGRMVLGSLLPAFDAAVSVSHATTITAAQAENDFFTALDDLSGGAGKAESAHIGVTELTSGVFYGYACIDLSTLVQNLTGCARTAWSEQDLTHAKSLVSAVIRAAATVSPGAKLGSTAPFAHAGVTMVELRTGQPRTLDDAFLLPVPNRDNPLAVGAARMAKHLHDSDRLFGGTTQRGVIGYSDLLAPFADIATDRGSLDDLVAWTAAQIGV